MATDISTPDMKAAWERRIKEISFSFLRLWPWKVRILGHKSFGTSAEPLVIGLIDFLARSIHLACKSQTVPCDRNSYTPNKHIGFESVGVPWRLGGYWDVLRSGRTDSITCISTDPESPQAVQVDRGG